MERPILESFDYNFQAVELNTTGRQTLSCPKLSGKTKAPSVQLRKGVWNKFFVIAAIENSQAKNEITIFVVGYVSCTCTSWLLCT